jgi:regulator of sigma E protease
MEHLLDLLRITGSFILILSVIVFVHEFGHYIVARWCGVRVVSFSIGFGREIWGFYDKRGTRWKVSMLPFGGYVKMYGDAGAASTPDSEFLATMTDRDRAEAFHFKPLWKKALIVAAGPAANFLLTIAIFFGFMFGNGVISTDPVVGEVMESSPAQEAGILAGDRILKVDDKEIVKFNDIVYSVMPNIGSPVVLQIDRAGEIISITLTPRMDEVTDPYGNVSKQARIGIKSMQHTVENVGVAGSLNEAVKRTWQICEMSLRVAGQMITGNRDASELKGPLGIAKISGQATDQGWEMILWFIALLSVNLGMVNLFPIPMLDGGHLMFYAVEAIIRRPLPERAMEYCYRFGAAILAMLMVFAFYNDIVQMLDGGNKTKTEAISR